MSASAPGVRAAFSNWPDFNERLRKRVAALIHDPALADNTELLETVGGTAGLALENEQLQADLRARLGALEQSERRFRELLENVHLIAVSLDLDGRITFCNQYLADLAGYSRAELIGRPWAETFNPADEQFMAQVREGSINPHEEMFILTRSGERREIAWNNTLLRDDAGRLIGSTSIGEDVTERNRATRRLLLQVQVARALAGSPSMDVARPLVLEHLTRALTCWLGIFWRPTPDRTALTVDAVVLTDAEDDAEFATAVRSMRLELGEALAGRTWQSSQPAWKASIRARWLPSPRAMIGKAEFLLSARTRRAISSAPISRMLVEQTIAAGKSYSSVVSANEGWVLAVTSKPSRIFTKTSPTRSALASKNASWPKTIRPTITPR